MLYFDTTTYFVDFICGPLYAVLSFYFLQEVQTTTTTFLSDSSTSRHTRALSAIIDMQATVLMLIGLKSLPLWFVVNVVVRVNGMLEMWFVIVACWMLFVNFIEICYYLQ